MKESVIELDNKKVLSDLTKIIPKENIKTNEPMSKHTTFKTGGDADFYVILDKENQVEALVKYSKENNLKLYIIGNGSNLLISDEGVRGIVAKVTFDDVLFEEEATPQAIYEEALAQGKVNPPTKKHITRRSGVCNGPSGRETYYNLKMDLVVKYMRKLGYKEKDYPYWVRDDGAKMLGNYVMVAANLKIRPKGTILECSLGTAIVCDTGGFVKKYPKGLDIAVNW